VIGRLIGLVMGSPVAAGGLLWALAAFAAVAVGLGGWALVERTGRFQALADAAALKADKRVLEAQVKVDADALGRCNSGAQAVADAGNGLKADIRAWLKAQASTAAAAAREGAAAGADAAVKAHAGDKAYDCRAAWDRIEKERGTR
jgi:hypothetical protein